MTFTKENNKLLRYFSALILILSILLAIYGFTNGWFSSVESMKSIILQNKGLAPLIFIFFQIFQVVVPIIPGSAGCIVGVLLFGPVWGFVYNYIGSCLGSFIAFSIAKTWGTNVNVIVTRLDNPDKFIGGRYENSNQRY